MSVMLVCPVELLESITTAEYKRYALFENKQTIFYKL